MRTVVAVILGYVVMAIVVFASVAALFAVVGADRAFRPGSFDPSALWLVVTLTLSLLAAIAGGWVAGWIGGSRAAKVLGGIVLVAGLLLAAPALIPGMDTRPTDRLAGMSNMEIMKNGRQPVWVTLALPFIGALGAIVGGSRSRR